MGISLEDKIAAKALVREECLRVSGGKPNISKLRAASLIAAGLAEPPSLDPLPAVIFPTEAARKLSARS